MKENWQKIEAIFHAALELESDQRDAFLKRECGGDDALRNEVEELLDGFDSNADFLSDPAFDVGMRALENARERSLIGRTFGPYEIVEKIGEGGMGEVYRAVDSRLDRTVALKFLSDALENDGRARRQLAKEARAAAALDHPNICSVFGLEEFDGQHFIVMQFIAGRTLSEILKERRLESGEFRSLAKQIIEAVAFAHSHGIIHRDLKPGNIMVGDDGRAKILDFGLAKAIAPNPLLGGGGDTSQFSNNGTLIGTVAYMSPEQLRGEKLDFRSDIFSLGIVLHEMLTGQNPFARPTQAETIAAILSGDLRSARARSVKLGELGGLLEKCVSAERADRPESVAEMIVEFDYARSMRRLKPELLRLLTFGLPALLVIVSLAGFGYLFSLERSSKPTIAVLPFRSADGVQENRDLAEGISLSVSDRLVRVRSITLKSGSVTNRYSEGELDLAKIASELSADAIVVGTLSVSDSVPVVITRIYRTADGSFIDESKHNLKSETTLVIAENISMRILGRVINSIPDDDLRALAKPETDSAEAKRFYDTGRILLRDRDKLDEAIDNFIKAKDLDLNYAQAWAGLAEAYLGKSVPGAPRSRSPQQLIQDARSCAAHALEIDPYLADAHYSLGLIALKYEWKWEAAEQSFRRALELDPEFIRARSGLINLFVFQSRFDEALEQANEIRRRDPVSLTSDIELAQIFYRMGDFSRMAEVLSILEEKYPNNQRIAYLRTYQQLAVGRFDEALMIIGPIYHNGPDRQKIYAAAPYGYALGKLGRDREARNVISELKRISDTKNVYVPAQEAALIYVGIGESDKVISQLRKSCEEKFSALPGWVTDPLVTEIRSAAAFAEIIDCTGL